MVELPDVDVMVDEMVPAVRLPGVKVSPWVVPILREDKVELPAVMIPGVKFVSWVVPILSSGPVSEPENTGSVELSLSLCRVWSVTGTSPSTVW